MHGAIFTRGPKDLHHTAIFIGGTDMAAGERLLAAVRKAFFGPMRVSVMLDSNGSNTTAVAAVAKLQQAVGDVHGRRAVVTAGTGPVGMRAAGLLAKAGADVDGHVAPAGRAARSSSRFSSGSARRSTQSTMADGSQRRRACSKAPSCCSTRARRRMLVPRDAWAGRAGLARRRRCQRGSAARHRRHRGQDNGVERDGVTTFGALGVGGLKMKIHKACIARLFERNDLVLDAGSDSRGCADGIDLS